MFKVLVLALVLASVSAEIIPFDSTGVTRIFNEKRAALFLFTDSNDASAAARQAFNELDTQAPEGVILTVSDKNDGHGLFERLGSYLGVDVESTPKFLYIDGEMAKFVYEGDNTAASLASFIEDVQAGKAERFLKSSPIPEDNSAPVKIGVGKNFKELVLESDKEILVEFYAPWCGHCKTLAPEYDAAAEKLKVNPNLLLVKVDSTENEIPGIDVQGFPTLYYFGKDKTEKPLEYSGERTAHGIINWMKEHTTYDWVDLEPLLSDL